MALNGIINKGSTLAICATPQNEDLTEAQFAALAWVDICCPTELPTFMQESEIVSEFCISGEEITAVGASTGAETELTVFYMADCVGQDHLRTAFAANQNSTVAYAVRKQLPDGVTGESTATTVYSRILVTSRSVAGNGGGVNDLVTDTYGWKIVQPPILVKPTTI